MGVLLFQMIASNKAYNQRIGYMNAQLNEGNFTFSLKNGDNPSNKVIDFLTKTLKRNPSDRLSW